MMLKFCIILTIINIANAGLLLWGPDVTHISALKHYNHDDLQKLLQDLNNPKIAVSNGDSVSENVLYPKNVKTAYIQNFNLDDSQDLLKNCDIVNESLAEYMMENAMHNTVVMFSNRIVKRELAESDLSIDVPKEPVLYSANGKAMIYSSQPPVLRTNSSSLILGKSSVVTLDTRDTYSKLSVAIPVDDGKVTLRFKFPWLNGYWSLTSVDVLDTENKQFTLNITKTVGASSHFSYHCFEQILFTDLNNSIELIFYEMQVQPDSRNGSFDDAFDCVFFTTVPILSGLFVVFILLIILTLGLQALGSIKTMDKFDNYKTKQLCITVAD